MKEKFIKFMQGRYGADQLYKFTTAVALVLIVLAIFTRPGSSLGASLNIAGFAVMIYTCFRFFSKNIQKRYEENQKYLLATAKMRQRFQIEKGRMAQRKTHHIYTCPGCGQKIRIPRGKGKIEIDCPRCHTKFVKRS